METNQPNSLVALTNRLPPFFSDMRFSAILVSLLLSVWCVFVDDVINNDGIVYLRAAELIGRGEWLAAIGSYKWFFYSLLIAIVSKATGLGLELSAHVLNASFTALTVVAFISLVRELGAGHSGIVAATILILMYPGLNEYRSYVIRDLGFLAFYMTAVLLFVKRLKVPSWRLTLGWIATMVVAALFRIEGVAFLVLLSVIEYFHRSTTPPTKLKIIISIALALLVLITTLSWWMFGTFSLSGVGAIGELVQALWQDLTANLSTKASAIADAVQDRYVADYALVILVVALTLVVILGVVDTLTPLYALLVGHALYRRMIFPLTKARTVWWWLVIVHVIALSAIVVVRLFITGRFPVALSLTLMLAAPFSVVALYERWRDRRGQGMKKNWLFPALCVALLVTGVDGLYSPTSKYHLKQAGVWLEENTAAESRLLSNSPVLLFYAGTADPMSEAVRDWNELVKIVQTGKWRDYDYLALRVKRSYEQHSAELRSGLGVPVVSFINHKGDAVWIYSNS